MFFTVCFIRAQEPVFVHFSEKNGLPDKEFYDLIEDSKGFIWLGGDKGFFRYDGKIYKKYTNELQRSSSVFNLQEDNLGRIWCNNISGQFFYLQEDKLELFVDFSKELKGQLADFIIKDNYLWIIGQYKLYKINLKSKIVEFSFSSPRLIFGKPFKFENEIYIGNTESIFKINSRNEFKISTNINLPSLGKNGKKILLYKLIIFKIGSNLFFRQRRDGINKYFKFKLSETKINIKNDFKELNNERIYDQYEKENEVWFATSSGVWVYELINESFKFKKRFLKNKNITKIVKDSDNNYWFTTLNNGIYVVPNINIESINISGDNKNISSLDRINSNSLIFGNTKGNLGFYDVTKNKVNIIKLPTNDRVSAIKYQAINNIIYISKDFNSYIIDKQTLKFTHHEVKYFTTAKSLTLLDDNKLLCTTNNGVTILNIGGDNKKLFDFFQKGKRTYASFYDKTRKSVFIAYVDNLIRYDSLWKSKRILYKSKPIYGKSITKTANGILWVSTFKDGVYGIKNDIVIEHFTAHNGLTSNNIGTIKADENQLWISLENSIQLLDVNTKKIETLTKRDGVVSYDITGIEILKNKVYFSSNEGLFSINKDEPFKTQNPNIYFNKVEINEKDTLITSNYDLKYNQNAIKIGFNVNGYLYNAKNRYKYRLKGFKDEWLTTDVLVNSVKYNSLPAGEYTFQVQPILGKEAYENKIKSIVFKINKPFWKAWWFVLIGFILLFGSTILYFNRKIKIEEKNRIAELEKISLEKELIAINLTALRSQMNPHFIFNALNSIQDLILKEDTEASYDYIVMFAELVRNTLNYSNQDFISIEKELSFLKVYLQLEKLRFGDMFNYSIQFDEKEYLEVPSLIIQPFIENALVHGLMHRSGKKELHIVLSLKERVLQCTIRDNGVGRKKADEIRNRQGNHHESFALRAIKKRLEIFKKQYSENIGYEIEDLYENEIAKGTKVTLMMPFKKRF